jgi:phosphoribosyl-AMP cyclohydrolase
VDDIIERVKWNADGLAPCVAQSADSGAVLMLAWMDAEALRRTLDTRQATYWSRSRRQHWVKGETSGHRQHVREARLDCDGDTILIRVDQTGPACHTGAATCFDDGLILADQTAQTAAGGGGRNVTEEPSPCHVREAA